ncbi:MAG: AmmeMemoRadiSam system protein B [Gammaproteobacteria bacterium]
MARSIKLPNVAGFFYPANKDDLITQISEFIEKAQAPTEPPKALIAPHAGYIYSGLTAAMAYKGLIPLKDSIKRVFVLGPAHYYPFRSVAAPHYRYYSTPLGEVSIDLKTIEMLVEKGLVEVIDDAFEREHSVEVHIPFLQYVLDDFEIVPLIVGHANLEQVAGVIEYARSLEKTFVVVSSDLSHYHSYDKAQSLDKNTVQAVLNGDIDAVGPYDACGHVPVKGLMLLAKKQHLTPKLLDMRNSGDTAGPKDRVVGYGAFEYV